MAEKHRKRYFIKEKEAEALLKEASKKLKKNLESLFNSKGGVELFETDFCEIFLVNGKPSFFKIGQNIYPTLTFDKALASMPKIVIDMGAVRHICNGANVMAPGIVRFEGEFEKGDLVVVVDEKYGKPLAIGETFYDDNQIGRIKHGVVVKNVHFVGDKIWNLIKEMGLLPVNR
ncbi:MAG: DUF1947 domain-containing protein [Candidatus Bathyarchaeia archaeon]